MFLTKRGARALLYQGHRYVINRRGVDSRVHWRCGKSRSCSGGMTTKDERIISVRDNHNHLADSIDCAGGTESCGQNA